jgi:hypothetical protein
MSANRTIPRGLLLCASAALLLVTACATPTSAGHRTARTAHPSATAASAVQAPAGSYVGLIKMGMPSAPEPFMSNEIAFTKHLRSTCGSVQNGYGPPADGGTCSMLADHGSACQPPPATHPIGSAYTDEVYVCHDHLMTAMDGASAGMIEFNANQLVDFSSGPATVSISRSTQANSSRDYTEFYFVPFAEQLAYSADGIIAETQKEARDYVRVVVATNGHETTFRVQERVGGGIHEVQGDWWDSVEARTGLVDSATIRTPIEFTLSRTHIRVSMNGFTPYDTDLPVPFPVTQAVFQVQHISYAPTQENGGTPNTWHWSNLIISHAVPYYQQMAMPEAVGDSGDYGWLGTTIHFAPAPAGALLRFQGFNYAPWQHSFASGFQISFDNGATWAAWHDMTPQDDGMGSFLQPIPEGATSAILRGQSGWYARDFYVMSLSARNAPPSTASTPMAMP